ncbi:MAG TPA: orotidine-5'-phosphate decarboxylase [Jatrophihabitans sp.]|nr:orotidine-5'-phosphate decarboxylase [Jatrophihabitans sp.]
MSFAQRLDRAMADRGPICLGIDPHASLLQQWGLADDLVSLERFVDTCVEALAGIAAVVKPQAAFFERFGSRGVAQLERCITGCRDAGALVIADVKRGDIGSTMAAYAEAYLGPESPLSVDAITVSPYLGVGALDPAFELAASGDRGVFVIALTSNPEAPTIQHARLADGRTVAQSVIDELGARNAGASPFGPFGVVVGATIGDLPPEVADLSGLNGPLLVPGLGAQGGTAADVRRIFGDELARVLPSLSREVLRGGPSVAGLQAAARRAIDEYAFLRG